MNKKILISFLLVVLIALSVASVSAEDAADVVANSEDADVVDVSDDAEVIAANTYQPTANTSVSVQEAINQATGSGDTVDLSNHASYDFGNQSVSISQNNIILKGDIL